MVTSTLLAGLGFSGGVISSFPSSVWPSRAPTPNPTSTRQTTEPTKPAQDATTSASVLAAKDNGEAGGEDRENSNGQGEDGEREGEDKDEEEEEEEDKDEKKERKGSRGVGEAGRKDNSTAVNEPPSETPDATAKEKEQTEPNPPNMLPNVEEQLEVYTHEAAAFPAPKDPAATLRPSTGGNKKHWPFSFHTGE